MNLSNKNQINLIWFYHFCDLYTVYRDFYLAKQIAKSKPLDFKQAEQLSNFCNQLITTSASKPQDFISEENESSNTAIENYLILKEKLLSIRQQIGTKNRDELYKKVKKFYRKKTFIYQMDSIFIWIIKGLVLYINDIITYQEFHDRYCFEISLFTGEKKPIKLKQIIKIKKYIETL